MADQWQDHQQPPRNDDAAKTVSVIIGAVLVLVGLSLLARGLFWPTIAIGRVWTIFRGVGWALGLILIGIIAIIWAQNPNFRGPARGSRLYRSRDEKMIAGVLGGLAEYLGMDPTIVRLGFVAFALILGFWPAIVIYIVALVIMPESPPQGGASAQTPWQAPPPPAPPVPPQQWQPPQPPAPQPWAPPAPPGPPVPPPPSATPPPGEMPPGSTSEEAR